MNKLLIGLLLLAAAGGAFFLLKKKKEQPVATAINKEWIIGKWKIGNFQPGKDPHAALFTGVMGLVDSNMLKYQYEFTTTGSILTSRGDSVTTDSLHYEWNKEDQLVWKEEPGDSTGNIFSVLKLSKDSLQVQTADSATFLFTKMK